MIQKTFVFTIMSFLFMSAQCQQQIGLQEERSHPLVEMKNKFSNDEYMQFAIGYVDGLIGT